jgi:hypothetical protein
MSKIREEMVTVRERLAKSGYRKTFLKVKNKKQVKVVSFVTV